MCPKCLCQVLQRPRLSRRQCLCEAYACWLVTFRVTPICSALSHSSLLHLPFLFSSSLSRAQGETLTCPEATSWLPRIWKSTSIRLSVCIHTTQKCRGGNFKCAGVVQMSPNCLVGVNGCACPMLLETPRPSHYPEEPFLQLDSTPLTRSPAAH